MSWRFGAIFRASPWCVPPAWRFVRSHSVGGDGDVVALDLADNVADAADGGDGTTAPWRVTSHDVAGSRVGNDVDLELDGVGEAVRDGGPRG